jgi:hypothetical protein
VTRISKETHAGDGASVQEIPSTAALVERKSHQERKAFKAKLKTWEILTESPSISVPIPGESHLSMEKPKASTSINWIQLRVN